MQEMCSTASTHSCMVSAAQYTHMQCVQIIDQLEYINIFYSCPLIASWQANILWLCCSSIQIHIGQHNGFIFSTKLVVKWVSTFVAILTTYSSSCNPAGRTTSNSMACMYVGINGNGMDSVSVTSTTIWLMNTGAVLQTSQGWRTAAHHRSRCEPFLYLHNTPSFSSGTASILIAVAEDRWKQ